MMNIIYLIISYLISSNAFADVKQKTSLDFGLQSAPSVTPELGYKKSSFRYGFDLGVSFFENQSYSLTSYPTKFLRLGVGQINNQPILSVAPFSACLYKQLYLTPSFGLGQKPYTLWGVTYTIFD